MTKSLVMMFDHGLLIKSQQKIQSKLTKFKTIEK